jgi:diaminopimelate decarboxylase
LSEAQGKIAQLFVELGELTGSPVRYLNLGGGFGIPYHEKDQPLDLQRVGQNLAEIVEKTLRPSFPDADLVLELGRYIVGECGVYVTRVVDRKVSRGQTYLVVDGGLHHQLAASGNFGQVIRRNYPVAIGNRMEAAGTESVSVVGCLCTPLDVLAEKTALPLAEVGDLVVVFEAGAYGLTASPTAFLGHPAPVEALI